MQKTEGCVHEGRIDTGNFGIVWRTLATGLEYPRLGFMVPLLRERSRRIDELLIEILFFDRHKECKSTAIPLSIWLW